MGRFFNRDAEVELRYRCSCGDTLTMKWNSPTGAPPDGSISEAIDHFKAIHRHGTTIEVRPVESKRCPALFSGSCEWRHVSGSDSLSECVHCGEVSGK